VPALGTFTAHEPLKPTRAILRRMSPIATLALLAPLAVLTWGCMTRNPYFDPAKPHHTPTGFRNSYPHDPPHGFWKWKREQLREGLPKKPEGGYRFEVASADVPTLANPSVTWIGHATVLVRVGGLNILTDPHFTERASPLALAGPRRVVPPAIPLAELPHIDAVLVSHSHYDHLDAPTVRALAAQPGGPPRYFVGLGLKPWFAAQGVISIDEMDWWESRELHGVTVRFVPVQHWSARSPWDRNETLWGGFVVEHPSLRFFFAGDTGYSQDFRDIAARVGPIDVAALPIGGYAPRWFMRTQHIDPAEAVQIHLDLGARHSLAIHWGTFDDLTDESLYEPPQQLAEVLAARGLQPESFWVFKHGETRSLGFLREVADRAGIASDAAAHRQR